MHTTCDEADIVLYSHCIVFTDNYSVKLNPLEKFFGCIRQHGRVLLGLQRLLETAGDLTSERKLKLKM